MIVKIRLFSAVIVSLILISLLTNIFFLGPMIMIGKADPGNRGNVWYNSTTLNVTVLEIPPRINWYDFQYNQSGTWISKRNAQIDVNNSAEYRFIVNISSDQGWDDIQYVNITACYDHGSEASTYNQTLGGNQNLKLQYKNTTGTAIWKLMWPTGGEVKEGKYSETVGFDKYGSPGHTECRNMTFSFIPGYQFRYAPGDGSWDNTRNATNNHWSWNFMITVTDSGEGAPEPKTVWIHDEFGVYSYSQIVSSGWPTIIGNPGDNATATSNITVVTRSNGNYSFSADVGNLTHKTFPGASISRDKVWVRGGDLATLTNFTAISGVIYFYGSAVTFHHAEDNGTGVITNDVEYKCNIPIGQMAGDYTAPIRYHLTTTQ